MRGGRRRGLLFVRKGFTVKTFSTIGCVICEAQKTQPEFREMLLNSGDGYPRRWW